MPARSALPGLKRVPRGGRLVWWWVASALTRYSAGFTPRTVRLWDGPAEPGAIEHELIRQECEQLAGALREWQSTGKLQKARARFRLGTIYFAKAGERVKIGFSGDADRRVTSMQVGSAEPIELLGTMTGTEAMERHLHHRFRALRIRGEWFRLDPRLQAYIADETRAPNIRETIPTDPLSESLQEVGII